jgi:HSP20 family protein
MAIKDLVPWKKSDKQSIVRHEDDPFYAFRREMDQVFDNFFGRGFGLTPFSGNFMEGFGEFNPRVDVTETDQEVRITAELPGLEEKDIDVSLSNDILTLKGEKKSEQEDKRENYYRMERSYGSFQRSIQLPQEVDGDKVEATFKNGVLQITLPKLHPGPGVKKISIKSG